MEASTGDTVVISKARLRDGGEYTCSITSEGDEYYNDKKKVNITVGGEWSPVFGGTLNFVTYSSFKVVDSSSSQMFRRSRTLVGGQYFP